jgi:hypothetical protein
MCMNRPICNAGPQPATARISYIRVRVDRNAIWPPVFSAFLVSTRERFNTPTAKLENNAPVPTFLLNHVDKMEPCDWFDYWRESGMGFAAFRSTRTLSHSSSMAMLD